MRHVSIKRPVVLASATLACLAVLGAPAPARADCVTSGGATTCDTTVPNPYTVRIGNGPTPADDGRSVTLNSGAQLVVGDTAAISLRDGNTIVLQPGALVSASAVSTLGLYGAGGNTIEFRNGNSLTIGQGSQVLAVGPAGNAEAIDFQGAGNRVVNSGTISTLNSAVFWSDNTTGLNTIINTETGIIQSPGSVIGYNDGNAALDFTNRGLIIGNLAFGDGNDILRIHPGSIITGGFNGGAGTDAVFLAGAGNGSMPGNFDGFETLTKTDAGTWTLTSGISGVSLTTVQQGTLILTGDNTGYLGRTVVDAAGILQARAQSLPRSVEDNGLLRFAQPDAGTYAGLISGTGAVEKTGAGVLTLAPAAAGGNTYSGGTLLNGGVLAVANDRALGAGTGGLSFNGGTLRFDAGFNLAATRGISLQAGGGTLDTNRFTTTLAQPITGPGGLTLAGGGTLVLTGESSYLGGTRILAGQLQLGTGGTSGSIRGDVANAGALVFNRSDDVAFAGRISGTGSVTQAGPGALTLGGANGYSGATLVAAGMLRAAAPGVFSPASAHTVAAGATLDLAGFDQAVGGLANAGLVTLNGAPGTVLTVNGNYAGNDGRLALRTVLAGDGAASDRLVVNGGTATGRTSVLVTNVGGPGALTAGDGIRLVGATNGGTTAPGAFALTGRVAAGPYEYQLFRGTPAGGGQEWFLRSSAPPVDPGANPAAPPIPLYRPEAALYAPLPELARQMGLATLGTLHERVGEEENLRARGTQGGLANGVWGRLMGERLENRWSGAVSPTAKGEIGGFQLGFDVYRYQGDTGHRDHLGLYVAYTNLNVRIGGFALGPSGQAVGRVLLEGPTLGAYWTHFGPSGWYLDAVMQGNWVDGNARSDFGTSAKLNGSVFTGSLEAGWPIRLSDKLRIEPQAQFISQTVSTETTEDAFSRVAWDSGHAATGRVGTRLSYTERDQGRFLQPYAKVNLWHRFDGQDRTRFGDATPVETRFGNTALEVGAGVTAQLTAVASLYANADYRWSVDGRSRQEALHGVAGLRLNW